MPGVVVFSFLVTWVLSSAMALAAAGKGTCRAPPAPSLAVAASLRGWAAASRPGHLLPYSPKPPAGLREPRGAWSCGHRAGRSPSSSAPHTSHRAPPAPQNLSGSLAQPRPHATPVPSAVVAPGRAVPIPHLPRGAGHRVRVPGRSAGVPAASRPLSPSVPARAHHKRAGTPRSQGPRIPPRLRGASGTPLPTG